jgi:hypothetical protein
VAVGEIDTTFVGADSIVTGPFAASIVTGKAGAADGEAPAVEVVELEDAHAASSKARASRNRLGRERIRYTVTPSRPSARPSDSAPRQVS